VSFVGEGVSRGLKPAFWGGVGVWAEAQTYPEARAKANAKQIPFGNDKTKGRCRFLRFAAE
jgi:hypothetical protein